MDVGEQLMRDEALNWAMLSNLTGCVIACVPLVVFAVLLVCLIRHYRQYRTEGTLDTIVPVSILVFVCFVIAVCFLQQALKTVVAPSLVYSENTSST